MQMADDTDRGQQYSPTKISTWASMLRALVMVRANTLGPMVLFTRVDIRFDYFLC
jgi:hypothetical protein